MSYPYQILPEVTPMSLCMKEKMRSTFKRDLLHLPASGKENYMYIQKYDIGSNNSRKVILRNDDLFKVLIN